MRGARCFFSLLLLREPAEVSEPAEERADEREDANDASEPASDESSDSERPSLAINCRRSAFCCRTVTNLTKA